jgi:short-subunit dehydrogenase
VFPEDLADPAAPGRLVEAVQARGLHVDLLINNAGFGVPGSYAGTTWRQQDDFLQVMVVAVAELTHRFLPGMIERQWGRIVNVSSLAGLLPGVAGHTLYAASKSFLVRFSESLSLEVRRHGVLVTAVCPGFTLSEFHDVTGTRDLMNAMPAYMWSDAETVARKSYAAVMRGDPVYVPGRLNATLVVAARVLPQRLVNGFMRRSGRRYRKT